MNLGFIKTNFKKLVLNLHIINKIFQLQLNLKNSKI